jgi:hypothetical protein
MRSVRNFENDCERSIDREEAEGSWSVQNKTAKRVVAVTMVVKSLLRDMCTAIDTTARASLVIRREGRNAEAFVGFYRR